MTNKEYGMIRDMFEMGMITREEFLEYLPAHINPEWEECGGYFIPATPTLIETSEPISSRFDILDL